MEENMIKGDKESYLMTAANDVEANITESLLNSFHIPVLKKHPGAGGYVEIYMGVSRLGVDLYVPSRLLEQAQEIIKNIPDEKIDEQNELKVQDEQDTAENSFEDMGKAYQKKIRIRTWIILLVCIIPGLILFVTGSIRYILRFLLNYE